MNNKNTGLIATIASALICGCCALFNCSMGIGTLTGNGTFTMGVTEESMPPAMGLVFLCFSLIAILVPVAVWFFTMRKKPAAPVDNEPLPPAS